ncbi:hypothetical protein HPB50_021201 [Hyalomma asiaticum]|uniref:Uncharacterized protein n=1 Tax=Hyalomma asiaticum TaxID=266040 RepID=A0ACB7RVE5_HYAAI|nr:hypothetical protein HPB50_021201 [Hyalomma asiaticum]
MEFASPTGSPPRPRHRRTLSTPTVLGPPPPELMKLTAERLRQHYVVGGDSLCKVDWWRDTQAAAATPASNSADAPELTASVGTQPSPVTAETPTSASKAPPPLLGATTAPSVGPLDLPASHVPLPTSDAEEDGMDVSTCRKRCRDDVSDDDDAPGPPRKTAASDDDPAAEGHLEACDDIAGSLPIPPCEPEPALSPTYHGGSFSASDSVPPANPATEVAVDLAELPAHDPGPAEPAPRCPSPKPLAPREPLRAADFLRDTPAAPPAAKSGKKSKKTQKRRRVPALLRHFRRPPQLLRPSLRHRRPSNSLTSQPLHRQMSFKHVLLAFVLVALVATLNEVSAHRYCKKNVGVICKPPNLKVCVFDEDGEVSERCKLCTGRISEPDPDPLTLSKARPSPTAKGCESGRPDVENTIPGPAQPSFSTLSTSAVHCK